MHEFNDGRCWMKFTSFLKGFLKSWNEALKNAPCIAYLKNYAPVADKQMPLEKLLRWSLSVFIGWRKIHFKHIIPITYPENGESPNA